MPRIPFVIPFLLVLAAGCTRTPAGPPGPAPGNRFAAWFRLTDSTAVTISPYDGREDTLRFDRPLRRIVCMSTSYVGYLDALGCDSLVCAVSGVPYVSQPRVRARAAEAGYEAALDYETLLSLRPDVVLTYAVSGLEPAYVLKLRELGIKVFILYEHLESLPLGRAEYVRLFGALTDRRPQAEGVFDAIAERYGRIAAAAAAAPVRRVLLNIPYGDAWYIPGADSYLSRLIRDAGGEVLGALPGRSDSRIVTVETAYALSRDADAWLHTGWCTTRAQLRAAHPLFSAFPVLDDGLVYDNTRRTTPAGGNDYWESGALRADLILEDLVTILHPECHRADSLHYYIEVQ